MKPASQSFGEVERDERSGMSRARSLHSQRSGPSEVGPLPCRESLHRRGSEGDLQPSAATASRSRNGDSAGRPRLELGPVEDAYELEAHRGAERLARDFAAGKRGVARTSAGPSTLEHHPISVNAPGGPAIDPGIEQEILARQGGGQPLAPGLRSYLERALGPEAASIRVHTDSTADRLAGALNAEAFAVGQDVFFRAGRYQPDSQAGQEVIFHEAIHTVQQADAGPVQRVQRWWPFSRRSNPPPEPAPSRPLRGLGIREILADRELRGQLRALLITTHDEELLPFYEACEEFERAPSPSKLRNIIHDFVRAGSSREINISGPLRDTLVAWPGSFANHTTTWQAGQDALDAAKRSVLRDMTWAVINHT